MGSLTGKINKASPSRLIEISNDLIKIKCEFCKTEKEDVKDARNSLRDYIAGVKSQLLALGVIGGGTAILGWKAIITKLSTMGRAGMLGVIVVGGLAIWWLYVVWKNILLRIRELRKTLINLDDCLQKHNCN